MGTTAGRDPILTFERIAKSYGPASVLDDVNLSVAPGDFMVVYGPPAAGKSVLMRILMGLERPTSGRVILRGDDVTKLAAADRNIGYVPQSFALYPHLSVHDNIADPLHLAGLPTGDSEPIVRHAAEMLKITDLVSKRPDQLSGGQKQRVAIARGIAKRSDLYVLDDPLAGLDFKLREQLVEDLRGLQQDSRATFLYTTSDAIEALTLADRLAVLDGGSIVEAGPPQSLYREPQHARTMALVGFPPANFLDGVLDFRSATPRCRTPLFEIPVQLAPSTPIDGSQVVVGLRPEDLIIVAGSDGDHTVNGRDDPRVRLPARIVLREDLGGEEIVYLDCAGTTLTAVTRRHARHDDLDEETTVAIDPRDLILFQPATGQRLGQGASASLVPDAPAPAVGSVAP